ncbi:unnamed protein product [Porites lobata]|uniref:Uncharacterized protein n=1 Tax=Porites lobata TaxID=104759 RepID=A0ABN8RPN4_9CNID|nr:unnamed protein product [Porites lobata]
MFASNLLAYSVTCSKLVLNIYGKLHPAGGITTARTWLNNLTMDVPQVPGGDILAAIDNDQVLIKKWTVRKDNQAQISVLTSVCVAPVHPEGTLQWDQSLSPGSWSKRSELWKKSEEDTVKLLDMCSASEDNKGLIRHENKKMIHELLHDLLMEQNKVNGEWKDDIDLRVDELKANEGRRVCPVCQTTMERV